MKHTPSQNLSKEAGSIPVVKLGLGSRSGLGSATRWKIYEIVKTRPGVSVGTVAGVAGVNWGTVAFHLEWLCSAGMTKTIRIGRRRLLFPAQAVGEHFLRERALISETTCRTVALMITQNPGSSIADLARLTGISDRALYYHVKQLRQAGLVEAMRRTFKNGLHATSKLHSLVASEVHSSDAAQRVPPSQPSD